MHVGAEHVFKTYSDKILHAGKAVMLAQSVEFTEQTLMDFSIFAY